MKINIEFKLIKKYFWRYNMKKEVEIKMACYALINTDEDITGDQTIED